MPAPISVVIPTLNAAHTLPRVANTLAAGLDAGLIHQLVISDGGSTDTTIQLAEGLGATLVQGAASRGGQIRRGVEAARADWLLIVHADTELGPDWVEAVRDHLKSPQTAGYFRLRFRATGWRPAVVAGWANLRSRLFGLPYGDQGLLIHRNLLKSVGGVPDLPLMEDVALARALSGRLLMLHAVASTSAERYVRDGWIRRSLHNAATLARYFMGVRPDRLASDYRRGSD